MKRMKINIVIFLTLLPIFLTSCFPAGLYMFDYMDNEYNEYSEHSEHREYSAHNDDIIVRLLSAINDGDKKAVRDMFAPNTIGADPEFDDKIDQLFNFVQGALVSYDDWGGAAEDAEFSSNQKLRIKYHRNDVVTNEQNYRFAIKECTVDTAHSDNVGICSLYVIKTEDDPYPEYAYWGDGNWTPGIHFNLYNAEIDE